MLRPEAVLQIGGEALRAASCLGGRSRFPRRDAYGRPAFAGSKGRPCCEGNIFTVVGSSPASGTIADCAAAMELDTGHMTYAEMGLCFVCVRAGCRARAALSFRIDVAYI